MELVGDGEEDCVVSSVTMVVVLVATLLWVSGSQILPLISRTFGGFLGLIAEQ